MHSSIGPYRVLEKIGQGGMGEVFLAEDRRLRRRVALKGLPKPSEPGSPERRRVLHEARAAAALNHPGIATIYDVIETEGSDYIVMEFVEGRSLAARLREEGRIPVPEAVEIGLQLADALAEAHTRGVLHRDLKPANVMSTASGRIKVLDFGLAHREMPPTDSQSTPLDLTEQGRKVLGTPAYVPPECLAGARADERSDIYSLGVTLFEMLVGRRPFGGAGSALLDAVLYAPVPSAEAAEPRVPKALDAIVSRAMARDPKARFASAGELAAALRAARDEIDAATTAPRPPGARLGPRAGAARSRLRWALLGLTVGAAVAVVSALRFGGPWLDPGVAPPPEEARRWYENGLTALRSGAYLTAARSLERAVALHDQYPLAHARLAEARAQLDDLDGARDALIHAQALVPELSRLEPGERLALAAIRAVVSRRFGEAVAAYEALRRALPEEAHVLVDLGRAQIANGQPAAARATLESAVRRDSDYAAAHLRLGEAYSNASRLEDAAGALSRAEDLYQASGNFEGVAEAAYQRGTLLNRFDRPAEARAQLERAVRLGREISNPHVQGRALFQLSSLAAAAGHTREAEAQATEGLRLASGLGSLAANGLIDLGNAYFVRGELAEADRHFRDALAAAERRKARRAEARARLSLASLRLSQNRPAEVEPLIARALAFYAVGGYRQEETQALGLRAEAALDLGRASEALRAFELQIELGRQLGEPALVASAHEGRGRAFAALERYREALEEFGAAESSYRELGYAVNLAYAQLKRAAILLEVGRLDEGEALSRALGKSRAGTPELDQMADWLAYLEGRIDLARGRRTQGMARFAWCVDHAAADRRLRVLARVEWAKALGGQGGAALPRGLDLAHQAVQEAKGLGQPQVVAAATGALAELNLAAGRLKEAQTAAREAVALAEEHGLVASGWRGARLFAPIQSLLREGPDLASARTAGERWEARARAAWGDELFLTYVSRQVPAAAGSIDSRTIAQSGARR